MDCKSMAITVCSNDGFVCESVESAMSQVVCSDDGKGGEEVGVEMEYSETTNAQSCDRRPPTRTTTISSIVDSSSYATSLHQRGGGILRSICRASTKKLVSVVTRSRNNKQRTRQTPKLVVRCEEEVHDQIATPSFTMDYNAQEEEDGRDEEVEIGQEVDHQQTLNNNNNRNVDNEEEEMVVVPSSDASNISSIVTTPNNHSGDNNKKQFWNDPVVARVQSPSSVSIISSIATITPNNASEEKEQVFWNDPVLARVRSPSTLTNVSGFSGTTRALLHAPSSITTSTCDFTNEINHHAMFESYLSSENPWDAARRGDYAALKYISKFDDQAVWTMEDEEHRVPLYYACMSYSLQNNDNNYDQQQQPPSSKLESVRLLVQTWPKERNFPKYLMDELPTIHADIRAILTRAEKKRRDVNNGVTRYQHQQLSSSSPLHLMKSRSTINFPPTINERYSNKRMLRSISTPEAALAGAAVGSASAASETLDVAPLIIDDVDQVVPMSFLEDLGDDGYVEDY